MSVLSLQFSEVKRGQVWLVRIRVEAGKSVHLVRMERPGPFQTEGEELREPLRLLRFSREPLDLARRI